MTPERMKDLQNAPYRYKLILAEGKAREFYEEIVSNRGLNVHVSIGGLDSITLWIFLKSIGLEIPAISVSSLEDKSIQQVHRAMGIERLRPGKSQAKVLQEDGFPVLSKDKANKIETICNPTPKNATVRHAIMTGETGKQGGYRKGTRMQLPLKWRKLFCGPANAEYGTDYLTAPFKVSSKCCYYMKEKPCDDWAKTHRSYPYLGLMASEGGRREKSLIKNGCNYYGKTTTRSCPFATWMHQDLLQLALDMDRWAESKGLLAQWGLDTIVPAVYGKIRKKPNGELYTTGAQRTGCTMCGFGIHLEKRPHRFDRLREKNAREWEFWMYRCATDPKTGEKYGWGRVLNYIGVPWEDDPYGNVSGQLDIFGTECR